MDPGSSGGKAKKKKVKPKLPDHLEQQRTHVTCGAEANYHTNTMTSANVYMPMGYDNSWDFDEFADEFRIEIKSLTDQVLEFDMIGIDPSIANALRRILIAEVPTIAIEHVFMIDNTSIIQDEVLSHRLGLVPLAVAPSLLEWRESGDSANEKNTVVLRLVAECRRENGVVIGDKVLSGQLEWLPGGSELPEETACRFNLGQAGQFPQPVRPVHDDILLAKMAPGQRIELEAHCVKGVGKDHAKFSPVATAWYRLHPSVKILQDIEGKMLDELLELAPGMFRARDAGGGRRVAEVADVRGNEKHLEKVRRLLEEERWRERLVVLKRKDHFIFTVESAGSLPPEQLFAEALDILYAKADKLASSL